MIPSEVSDPEQNYINGNFISGVVEGFYGRPWTTEQRKKLFKRMKKMGMNTYLYAPKDDAKHRMFWREQYSVEEADHLTGLISAAEECNVSFMYAISPGLDITFSSNKDVAMLKKKLEQVSSFGCKSFAILFDDIEVDMCDGDKEVFQSFAHAQVSVTNEVYQHLSQPKFLFCPTEYCASRAVPNVASSGYLNTIGSKLLPGIDILWTGPKVVSKKISIKTIMEVSKSLCRPPVIWDNIHANDYDPKRLFLGPYEGRSPELIPYIRGVLTNPNCEFEANYVAMHTLAQWCRSNVDGVRREPLPSDSPIRADIKLETDSDCAEDDDLPFCLNSKYQPKQALHSALSDWLEEILYDCTTKPKKISSSFAATDLAMPNTLPSVANSCMASSTTLISKTLDPNAGPLLPSGVKNLNELVGPCMEMNDSYIQPVMSTVPINSLVDSDSEAESCSDIAENSGEPMDCAVTPGTSPASSHCLSPQIALDLEELVVNTSSNNSVSKNEPCNNLMQVDSEASIASKMSTMETIDNVDNLTTPLETSTFSYSDLMLLVDLFYMPFEHGSAALEMLTDFYWLKANADILKEKVIKTADGSQEQVSCEQWQLRFAKLKDSLGAFNTMVDRFCAVPNKAFVYDIYPYVWDMKYVLSVLHTYVDWLALGQDLSKTSIYLHGNPYTWANRQYVEAFTNGEQEPWVFRGGLQADFQRLLPLDGAADVMLPLFPLVPSPTMCNVRPYLPPDEAAVYKVCLQTCDDTADGSDVFTDYEELIPDRRIGAYLCSSPEFCFTVEDPLHQVCGYVVAAPDAQIFYKKMEIAWLPALKEKYPQPDKTAVQPSPADEVINTIYSFQPFLPDTLFNLLPSILRLSILPSCEDVTVFRRTMAAAVAALRSTGSHGVHVEVPTGDKQTIDMYNKLGFLPVTTLEPVPDDIIILGRAI